MMKAATLQTLLTPWLLFVIVVTIPFIAWGGAQEWDLSKLLTLSAFPLLGLWAWGIMWTHYVLECLRNLSEKFQNNAAYQKISGVLVLLFLFLHPGLLALQQFRLTEKLPPDSYFSYVSSSQEVFILFGIISVLIFLSFEVFNRIKETPFMQRNWRWVSLSQMVAMTLIFFHGLGIGSILESPSLELYWVALGVLLIPCFGVVGREDWSSGR
jgi:hypothetical protein